MQEILKYQFKNTLLLEQALTHSSRGGKEFQRLEFLGDRVLNICLTMLLLKQYPTAKEGELAKRLSILASANVLKQIGLKWELNKILNCTPTQTLAILSDASEAVLGAIFIDANYNLEKTLSIIDNFWHELIIDSRDYDAKTQLQEIVYKLFKTSPIYETEMIDGKDHQPVFKSKVKVSNKIHYGLGGSIKEAEKVAAENMLLELIK